MLPIKRESVLKSAGSFGVSAYEGIAQFSVGIDDAKGAIALLVWSAAERLSGFRMSPDMANGMGQALLNGANQVGPRQMLS